MRQVLALVLYLCLCGTLATAQDWEDQRRFGASTAPATLRVLSSTDTQLFAPVLEGFIADNSGIAIDYFVAGTADIDAIVRQEGSPFDVVISSAMDLQFKLANDGYALQLRTINTAGREQWRQSLFAFTTEPAAIVLNRADFAGGPIPRTRQELIQTLRANPAQFQGRLGTYDVRQSGLGYLFATQDARTSETYWRLMEVMGGLEARLYCCSGAMIEDVADGTIAVAYNVLGSYAQARDDLSEQIEIILPTDFQTIMMRTALVSADTRHPDVAATFVEYLLRQPNILAPQNTPTTATNAAANAATTAAAVSQATISLGPALLTYLDGFKSQRFLEEWTNAMIQ